MSARTAGLGADLKQARAFLRMLDPARTDWEFRTFDDVVMPDGSKRRDRTLTRTFGGGLNEFAGQLQDLSARGAGVFVTINRTDGKGRSTENITNVVAIFADTDGAELTPLLAVQPHIVVRSSLGKWHPYYRVDDCELSRFAPVQKALARTFGTDPAVHDLPRVMRLPGFPHQKHEPTMVTFEPKFMDARRKPYTVAEIVAGLGLTIGRSPTPERSQVPSNAALAGQNALPASPENVANVEGMLAAIDPNIRRADWRQIIWATLSTGWTCAEALARRWSETGLDWNKDGKDVFDSIVRSFDPDRATGLRALVSHARNYGWSPQAHSSEQIVALYAQEGRTSDAGDVRNGRLFADMFRDKLLHVDETNCWLSFVPEQGWLKAAPLEEDRAAKDVLRRMHDQAAECWKLMPHDPNTKRMMEHVVRTSQLPRLRAMVEIAKSEGGMTATLLDFDADPLLLGVANGVLDLRSGVLTAVAPDVRVSKRAAVAYDSTAQCPRFLQFLKEVQPDAEMRAFLRRFVGYCLTGEVGEHVFLFVYGLGANGKSIFVETVAWLLGDYAQKIATEMLMQHQRSRISRRYGRRWRVDQ